MSLFNKETLLNWRGYLVAIGLVALATWLKYLAQPDIIPPNVPILYIVVIIITATFFGLGPSISACVLSVLAYDFFFIPPINSLSALGIEDYPIVAIFFMVGVLISYLSSNLRHKREEAVREIVTRKKVEAELINYRNHLEELVKQRTIDLEKVNIELKQEVIERSKAQESLRVSEQRWATILASIGDGVVATDVSGRVTFMNAVAEGITGWSHREALAKPITEVFKIINEHTRQQVDNPVNKVLQQGIICGLANHTLLVRKNGTEVAIDDSGAPIKDEKGSITGAVLIFRDITERKMAEDMLKHYTAELETANKELEAFSYSVSHDLRAPLRILNGFSQAVIEDYGNKLDEKGKDYLNRIGDASQLMAQLIDDMLKLSRVTRTEMYFDRVNLSDMVKSIVEQFKNSLPKRQVEFIIVPEVTAFGDAGLLQSALQNLLENAWKFTGKCLQTRIEFGVLQKDRQNIYFVKDNGAGFNMKYADKLFQPFQRLHSSKDYPGTGIGLATIQRIIRRHGGKVWAEGEIDKGATFFFTLNQE